MSVSGADSSALAEGVVGTSTIRGKQGEYQITAPATWSTTQKAGADVLVISPDAKSTNVGVTAVPVRVQTLVRRPSHSTESGCSKHRCRDESNVYNVAGRVW
jgi:hypothetical protein